MIAFVLFALERSQRQRARQTSASGRRRPPRRVDLDPVRGAVAALLCLSPVLIGLVIPLGRLTYLAFHAPMARDLFQAASHSLTLAILSGLAAAAIGLFCAYALRSKKPVAVAAARLAGLGYAVPGSVAALGVLVLLGGLQSGLDDAWTRLTGVQFPLLLSGGVLALIFAYQSRFAAAAIGPSESALQRVTPRSTWPPARWAPGRVRPPGGCTAHGDVGFASGGASGVRRGAQGIAGHHDPAPVQL